MKPLFVPKFASHSQDATSVARLTGASAYEHPEELLQPKKRRTVRTADIKFDPLPGPPPLRCSVPGCGRPTFPDWPGERACMVHGEARRLIRSWENATATTVTRTLGDNLADWLERLPEAAIVKAIAETGASNARNWRYCEAILRRYEIEGWADKPKGRVITFDEDLPFPEGMDLPEVRFER